MDKNVAILIFSGRNNGNCVNIGNYISNYHISDHISTFQLNDIAPCGNCDYECLKPDVKCPNLTDQYDQLMAAVAASDLVYYIIPNFCGFPCASYFAFNERSVGYFNGDRAVMNQYMSAKKRFIMVSNSENDFFKEAASRQTTEEPDILYLKTGKYRRNSIAGDILESEDAKADLEAFLQEYTFV